MPVYHIRVSVQDLDTQIPTQLPENAADGADDDPSTSIPDICIRDPAIVPGSWFQIDPGVVVSVFWGCEPPNKSSLSLNLPPFNHLHHPSFKYKIKYF